MAKKVIILGGGVAGMSAAHELMERGFQVTVYEKHPIPGGKARSMPVPNTGKEGNRDLPGEHGFRFFPSFYRHVTDTMKRIPYKNNKRGVYDNLTSGSLAEVTRYRKPGVIAVTHFPRSFQDLKDMLQAGKDFETLGFEAGELEFFAGKLWQYLTSCERRRLDELERVGWWEYVEAGSKSEAYQKFLAEGITRSLIAADAHVANARVEGHIGTLMMIGLSEPWVNTDHLLNGPTNDVWMGPWLAYLEGKGVHYCLQTRIDTIHYDGREVTGVTLRREDETTFDDRADYYILAVPVEQAARLFAEKRHAGLLQADPVLKGVIELGKQVAWMNGIQFYLHQDVPMIRGHMIHIDTEWSLTSVSQAQFWQGFPWSKVGQGNVNGILSVDISDWNSKGRKIQKPARECTREEIKTEVWEQLKLSVNTPGKPEILRDEDLVGFFLDPDIEDHAYRRNPSLYKDAEPLYIDETDSWHLRPDAYTRIPNLFLASDYVRTNTQLASMEGANEAARRAVNAILSASRSPAPLCRIWSLHEPYMFAIWRWHDQRRYERGELWQSDFPWFIEAAQWLIAHAAHLWYIVTGRKRKAA
ncbi:MAG TPA: FAD-dependent oxidoreductase [Anaerolineales bacterium]|nr:FAD-dependent oxidoreductase [Anaerolineales bacterium]